MSDCMYCDRDERLNALMFPVYTFDHARLYLYRENTYPGRCVLVPERHVQYLTALTDEERDAFFAVAVKAARAIEKAFHPAQINYLFFGDSLPHLHLHMVPKYRDGADFCKLFRMMPDNGHLMDDAECSKQADMIRAELIREISE